MKKLSSFSALVMTSLFLTACTSDNVTPASPDLNTNDSVPTAVPTQDLPSTPSEDTLDTPSAQEPSTSAPAVTPAIYEIGLIQPFDQQKFEAAQADQKTVFLDFYASWCPTCRANAPIIEAGLKDSEVVAFRVDYDTATELKKQYKVTYQSTYILLDGSEESRQTGNFSEADFKAFIQS